MMRENLRAFWPIGVVFGLVGNTAVASTCDGTSNSCYSDGTQSVNTFYETKFVKNETAGSRQWGYISDNKGNDDRVNVGVQYDSTDTAGIKAFANGNAGSIGPGHGDDSRIRDLTISLFNGTPAAHTPYNTGATGQYYFHDIYLNLKGVKDVKAEVTTTAGVHTYTIQNVNGEGEGKSYFYIDVGTTDYIESIHLFAFGSNENRGIGQLKQVYFSGPVTAESSIPPSGAVPVPAAVWLFGSALLGMVGISRRGTFAAKA